jgi:hypothetical protein
MWLFPVPLGNNNTPRSVEHGVSQTNLNLLFLARFSAAFASITLLDSLHRRVARAWQTDDLRTRLSIDQIPLETAYDGPKTNYMTSFVDLNWDLETTGRAPTKNCKQLHYSPRRP